MMASLALYDARQDGYSEYGGINPDTGQSYYVGIDAQSQGFEVELQGRITDQWTMLAGFANVEVEDPHTNDDVRTYVPGNTFNLGTRYRFDALPGLEIGSTVKWQDDTHIDTFGGEVRQDGYAVVSGYLSYEFMDKYEIAVNGYNLTDEKDLTSLYWEQSFYGPPAYWTATFRAQL